MSSTLPNHTIDPRPGSGPPCLNCGSNSSVEWTTAYDIEYRTTPEAFEYRRCEDCGALFLVDPPVDRLGTIYPSNYYSFQPNDRSILQRVKTSMDRRSIAAVSSQVPGTSLSVLDVGGGVGFMADTARAADPRIAASVVVDLDEQCRPEAERRGHDFSSSRIEEFDADGRSFDLILAYNLIEHVQAPRQVLRAFADLLTPDGRIIVKTPNFDAWDERLFRHSSWGGYHCPRHWVLFDRPSFEESAAVSGLVVDEFHYTQGAPFWAVNIADRVQSLGPLNRPDEVAIVDTRSYKAALALSAVFDIARAPFAKTSQMVVVLRLGDDAR